MSSSLSSQAVATFSSSSKKLRNQLIARASETNDFETAALCVDGLLKTYSGAGLYILAPIRALVAFRIPDAFELAIAAFFAVIFKFIWHAKPNTSAFWSSLKRRKGLASSCLDLFDRTLVQIIATHRARPSTSGNELRWCPTSMIQKVVEIWTALLREIPTHWIVRGRSGTPLSRPFKHTFSANSMPIFTRTMALLAFIHKRKSCCLRVARAIDGRLPQEIQDMIMETLWPGVHYLRRIIRLASIDKQPAGERKVTVQQSRSLQKASWFCSRPQIFWHNLSLAIRSFTSVLRPFVEAVAA